MEDCIEPQFDKWMAYFTPDCQFGFVKGSGTDDYGAGITMTMLVHLDSRGEGILVSLDVKGAFDRVWWSRLKARLKAKGMIGKALKLLRDYLWRRFIQVVHNGDASELKEIFSGVPQGAKVSPKLWNFDISDMEHFLSFLCMLICYTDDCGLWYAITELNRHHIVVRTRSMQTLHLFCSGVMTTKPHSNLPRHISPSFLTALLTGSISAFLFLESCLTELLWRESLL